MAGAAGSRVLACSMTYNALGACGLHRSLRTIYGTPSVPVVHAWIEPTSVPIPDFAVSHSQIILSRRPDVNCNSK